LTLNKNKAHTSDRKIHVRAIMLHKGVPYVIESLILMPQRQELQ
jgi:hypothetical protein